MLAISCVSLEEGHDGLRIKVDYPEQYDLKGTGLCDELFHLAETHYQKRWFLDLNGLDYLSGAVLTDLLRLDQQLRAGGGRLSLRNLNPILYDIFHICRLTDLLDVQMRP
jgi:anti-anti-sigma factor